jgi:hypothetical protein
VNAKNASRDDSFERVNFFRASFVNTLDMICGFWVLFLVRIWRDSWKDFVVFWEFVDFEGFFGGKI